MHKKWIVRIILFCTMILVMMALAAIRSQNSLDRHNQKIILLPQKTVTCTVDLSKQGVVKKLLNPNVYTLYLRIKADNKHSLRCEGNGIEMFLSQGTKKGIWKELKPQDILQQRRGSIPINVELKVPYAALKNRNVAEGALEFFDENGLYSKVMIKVINSQAG